MSKLNTHLVVKSFRDDKNWKYGYSVCATDTGAHVCYQLVSMADGDLDSKSFDNYNEMLESMNVQPVPLDKSETFDSIELSEGL